MAFAAALYMSNTPNFNKNSLIAVWVIIGITFVLGMMSSLLMFLAGS